MLRRFASTFALTLAVLAVHSFASSESVEAAEMKTIVGPSRIYYADADTVFFLATKEWISKSTRHQEKLLRTALRLNYWRNRIPPDMRRVFDALGYPTGRVLTTPIGHTEEAWYYGQLSPPLRFRDGVLLDESRFQALRSSR